MCGSDGFGYDLNAAKLHGNIFERIFHNRRLSFWLSVTSYSGKRVLDIGCNTGIILIPLKEQGVDVLGIDISGADIDKAKRNLRQRGLPDNCVRIADAKKLPYYANSFDIILLSDILEHVGSPELVAKESIRVLKTGGLILATVPNELHPVVRYPWVRKLLTGRKNVDEHLDVPFSKNKLVKLFPGMVPAKVCFMGFGSEIFGIFRK